MPNLPRPLSVVIKECRTVGSGGEVGENFRELVAQAFVLVNQGVSILEGYSWSLIWNDRVRALLSSGFREVDAQKIALHDVELALNPLDREKLFEAGMALEASSESLQVVWRSLHEVARSSRSVSPYESIDKLLKASYNVLLGLFTDAPIRRLFKPACALVVGLGAAVKRYELFYGSDELSEQAQVAMRSLEMGFGAIDEFLRRGEKTALRDGVRLITPNSVSIYKLLQELGESASTKRKFSVNPLAEELYRARECAMSGRELVLLWKAISLALQEDIKQAQFLITQPLSILSQVDTESLRAVVKELTPIFNQATSLPIAEAPIEKLDELLRQLSGLLVSEEQKIQRDYSIVMGSEHFEELIVTVGLAMLGQISPESFLVMMDHMRSMLVNLTEDVDTYGPELGEEQYLLLREAMESQYAAFEEMSFWCQDQDISHLRAGWQEITVSLPVLSGFTDAMREKISQASGSQEQNVPCFRCGNLNKPGSRFCSACNAPIMQLMGDDREYMDLSGEPSSSNSPENLKILEDLVQRVEEGGVSGEEVYRIIGEQLCLAQSIKKSFEQQFSQGALAAAKDSESVVNFREALESYLEGLTMMREFAANRRTEYLYAGLSACQQASAAMLSNR